MVRYGQEFQCQHYSNSQVGIADHAVVDATFLMELSQMLLLLQHLGYHADWHFGTVPHC